VNGWSALCKTFSSFDRFDGTCLQEDSSTLNAIQSRYSCPYQPWLVYP